MNLAEIEARVATEYEYAADYPALQQAIADLKSVLAYVYELRSAIPSQQQAQLPSALQALSDAGSQAAPPLTEEEKKYFAAFTR